ncbi:MAG: hypothetical protein NW703_11450 [Nitrospiraceae bacterium]
MRQPVQASLSIGWTLTILAPAGGGKYVTCLAYLYDIPVARHGEFVRLVRNRPSDRFGTGLNENRPAPLKMVQALNRALAADS